MTLLCALALIILFWSYPGYLLFLRASVRFPPRRLPDSPGPAVGLSVIIPTYNEKEIIREKIDNLASCVFSGPIEFIFADASDDDTPLLIEQGIRGWPRPVRLLRCSGRGRRNQINEALALVSHEVVVISDADALMGKDVLEKIAPVFTDPRVAVVGACVEPVAGYGPDGAYWKAHNAVRELESRLGHCSAVSGACYAFRCSLIDRIPEGVWADDIHLPMAAHFSGKHCIFISDTQVRETRVPRTLGDFMSTKARKAGDYMIELLRFLPKMGTTDGSWRIIYITKLIQLFAAPAAACVIVFCAGALFGSPLLPGVLALILLASALVCARLKQGCLRKITDTFVVFVLTNAALLAALVLLVRHGGKSWYRK